MSERKGGIDNLKRGVKCRNFKRTKKDTLRRIAYEFKIFMACLLGAITRVCLRPALSSLIQQEWLTCLSR